MSAHAWRCRWDGKPTERSPDPAGRGRRKEWCDLRCTAAYERAFGTRRWEGGVLLVTKCGQCGTRELDELPGPVTAPGAWMLAAQVTASAVHGHPVSTTVWRLTPDEVRGVKF